jgi:hypothetical protein
MIFHSIASIIAQRERILREFQDRTENLRPDQTRFHPAEGRWSIAEIAEHVAIVDVQLLQLIAMLLKKCEDAGSVRPPSGITISVEALIAKAQSEKYVTREKFEPTGNVPLADALRTLRETHGQLGALIPRLEAVDPGAASFPHWFLGPLTLGQWLAFTGYHIERHSDQIASVTTLPQFRK